MITFINSNIGYIIFTGDETDASYLSRTSTTKKKIEANGRAALPNKKLPYVSKKKICKFYEMNP